MTVNATSASSSAATDTTAATTTATKKSTLGAEDFIKLLAVQFQSQDPMKPMEDTAFIAQMAQFTSLQQSSSLLTEVTSLRNDQQRVEAQSYIGRNVTVDDGNGGYVTGQVSGVEQDTDGPRLVIGNSTYSLSSVLLVEPGATTASTSNTQASDLPPAA